MRTPSELKGIANGKLPPRLLVECGIKGFKMSPTAARAMRALVAAATADGIQVRATGTYRSYAQQLALFRARYTTVRLPGRPFKVWEGQTWWQKPRTAMASTPGKSNHGLGLACDFAEELNGKPGVESISPRFTQWLVKNAATYGFKNEVGVSKEPWHWTYSTGDKLPQAVLDFERRIP